MNALVKQGGLFDAEQQFPNGLLYRADFLDCEREAALLEFFRTLPFREARFQQYTARRRVVRFGAGEYLNEEKCEEQDFPRLEFPPLLAALKTGIAGWLGIPESRFVHGLVTEYLPGTPIGWHCDAPHFDDVVGISLANPCRMRFRPVQARKSEHPVAIELQPRSAYVMRGDIRWCWQHSIAPTKAVRYSVTMRTLLQPQVTGAAPARA